MPKFTKLILVIMVLIFAGAVNAQSQDAPTPEEHLMQYINAINLGNYATAYSMWQAPVQTYQEFIAGFSETERIVPYFGRVGVGAGSAYVTTILLGYQTDGTVETYYGYFQLANGGNYAPPIEGWVMSSSRFDLINDGYPLQNSVMQSLLSVEWQENIAVEVPLGTGEMGNIWSTVILDYYDLINERQFGLAYQQWLSPYTHAIATDYRLPYNQFVSGYGDTSYVMVYTGQYQAANFVPTILVGQHTDGDFVTYYGCYALDTLNATDIGIVNGRFYLLQDGVPSATTIFNTLNTLNCASLGIPTT